MIDTWVDVWKLVTFILLCAGRYFLIPTSYNPLAAYSTTLAQLITVSHWAMMGAYLHSALRHDCYTRPAGSVQKEDDAEAAEVSLVDEAELELEDNTLEEIGEEIAEASPEEAEADAEAQPQFMEAPRKDIQEEVAIVIGILAHGIKLKDPQSWSPLEQLLINHWDALQ